MAEAGVRVIAPGAGLLIAIADDAEMPPPGAGYPRAATSSSVRFLVRWFRTRTLWPFGIYCILAGAACTAYFA